MSTDVKRKLDPMDWMLGSAKVAQDRKEYPVVADYPEIVQNTLILFCRIFALSSSSIPSKKSSTYGEWIKELTQLNTICPTSALMERAIEISFRNYMENKNKFTIARPIAIKRLLINAMREINLEERKRKAEAPISNETAKKTVEKLTSFFEE